MKSTAKLAILSIITLILFGSCAFFMRNLMFGGVVATYEEAALDYTRYSEKWISYEAIACLGAYCEETETYSFIPTGHSYYYMMWMADGSIMPMSVSKKSDREYLDKLTYATYDYIDGKTRMIEMEPRTFTGTVKTQGGEVNSYYTGALDDMQIYESDGWVIRTVLLDCTSSRTGYILLCGGLVLLPVFGIVFTVINAQKEKRKKMNPEDEYLPR